MGNFRFLLILILLFVGACSFKKNEQDRSYSAGEKQDIVVEHSLVDAVRYKSKNEVLLLLRDKSISELESIYSISGDPLVLVAARRGSVEILSFLRGRGLNLWSKNIKTGESLLSDLGIVSVEVEPAIKRYLNGEIDKGLKIGMPYVLKGDIGVGLAALANAHIPCKIFTRTMLRFLWANPHISEMPSFSELVKVPECNPVSDQQEARDFLLLEFGTRIKYDLKSFKTLSAMASTFNTKIPVFNFSPMLPDKNGELVQSNMTFNATALVYLFEKVDSTGEIKATTADVSAATELLYTITEGSDLILHISGLSGNPVSIMNSEVAYRYPLLDSYRKNIQMEFNRVLDLVSKKYNLEEYAIYPNDERSE